MSSPATSPQKKRLRLSRKINNENEDEKGLNNRAKIDSNEVKFEVLKKENFMKACLQVSYEAYIDFKKRFLLLNLPICIDNECIHHDDKNANITQISPSTEQYFNIEMKNKTWFEALEVCLMCITSNQYLSANMLKDIVEIIMNAHEDDTSGYTIDYVLRQCQHALSLHFRLHPPCVIKGVRDCYKKFLTSSMDKKENTLSNRINYHSEEGIVFHCLCRLMYEISMESRDDALLDKQEIPQEVVDKGVKIVHWKKENLELFEFLVRKERIERLMLVLESLIYLLQADLALWHSRRFSTNCQMRSQKPLLAYVLWPINCLTNGAFTKECRKIVELFAYFIHLKYPEQHIRTMSLWMNTVIQMFYMYERNSHIDYPNTSLCCAAFAKEFCKILLPLPTTSILRILERIKPSFMQHLVGLNLIKTFLNTNQTDIILIIISSVNNESWDFFSQGDSISTVPKICLKSKVKPHKLLDLLSTKCRNYLSATEIEKSDKISTNSYPKHDLKDTTCKIHTDFIRILFITFVAYLKTYNITNFNQTLNCLNESLHKSILSSNEFQISLYEPYSVSDHFVKKYRSIIESLQELFRILEKKDDENSKNLMKLINRFFS